jgi:mono/diheme cytochrome c family protein
MIARSRRHRAAHPLVLAALLLATLGGTADADGSAPIAIGLEQVEHGAAVYRTSCGFCHGAELQGSGFPALTGPAFAERWDGRPLGELLTFVRTSMPLGQAGSLTDEAYADVVAFILSHNGVEPGDVPFTGTEDAASTTPLDLAD